MGIKPFLCLRGKLLKENLSTKNTLSVKDRIKQFEVEAKDVTEAKDPKKVKVESDMRSEKMKRMLRIYEDGSPLIKKMVREPDKVVLEPDKDLEDKEADTRNEVTIRNAFEVLMTNGDTRIKSPRKSVMKAKKSSVAKRRKV